MVNSIKFTNKVVGGNEAPVGAIVSILKFEMIKDESLFDIFMDDIQELGFKFIAEYINEQVQESEKMDAMNKVDPDALFRKATGQEDNEENHEAEDDVEKALFGFLNSLFDVLK